MTEDRPDLAAIDLVVDKSLEWMGKKDVVTHAISLLTKEDSRQEIEDLESGKVCTEKTKNHEQENLVNANEEKPSPRVGMEFSSVDEVRIFYNKYACDQGFAVMVRTSSAKENNNNEKVKYHTLACARSGKTVRTSKNTLAPKPSSKIECKARVNFKEFEDGKVVLTSVIYEHNHGLSPGKSRYFKCNKKLDARVKKRLELNDQAGISLNKNFHSLVVEAGGYENLKFGKRDARNFIDQARRLRLGEGDAQSLNNYFERMQNINPNFFYRLDLNDDGHIKSIFWADARSRAMYESFSDIITFDTTYLTNKYDMPFAPFVGVNHHGQSILLGCGLLSNEKEKSYIWLFRTWLSCMAGRVPNAIITDQCKSIGGAISVVFKGVKHRFCLWHIMKKIPDKLSRLTQYKAIKKTLKNIVYESLTIDEFEKGWSKFILDYKLQDNGWLDSLYKERKRWIPVFVKETFWAGMSTTQRSESINAFFDGYVHSKTSLKQFVEQYDHALRSKAEKEKQADFASYNSVIATITRFHFEKQFQDAYTNEIFKLFQNELRGLMYCNSVFVKIEGSVSLFKVNDDVEKKDGSTRKVDFDVYYIKDECDISCTCRLFEFKGILCRHSISVLAKNGVRDIPSRYILNRWRKDIKRKHNYVRSSYDDFGCSEEVKRYDTLCNRFYVAAEVGAKNDNHSQYLLKLIDYSIDKMLGEQQVSPNVNLNPENLPLLDNEVNYSKTKLLSPIKSRSKGRPPSKRKESKVEVFMKNQKKKDKKSSNNKCDGEIEYSRTSKKKKVEHEISSSKESSVVPLKLEELQGRVI